jgi:hypothetical protein
LQGAAGPEASENVAEVPGKTRVQKLRAIKRAPTLMSRRLRAYGYCTAVRISGQI